MKEKKRKKIRKRVSIPKLTRISFLPSVFTMFNLFLGYMALLQILNNNFLNAAYLISLSVVVDGFDGTIARLTKTESNFGMQLDSLADAVSFGLVPALFMFLWGFQAVLPENGKIISFIFLSAGIIRLARFNIYKEVKAYADNIFIGLPIPFAALSVLAIFFLVRDPIIQKEHAIMFAVYIIIVSVLMISNIQYRTIKRIKSKHSFIILFLIAILISLAIMYTFLMIPILALTYLVSPVFFYFFKKWKKDNSESGEGESSELDTVK